MREIRNTREYNPYTPKPTTYKILKHINQDIRESVESCCTLNKHLYSSITRNYGLTQNTSKDF